MLSDEELIFNGTLGHLLEGQLLVAAVPRGRHHISGDPDGIDERSGPMWLNRNSQNSMSKDGGVEVDPKAGNEGEELRRAQNEVPPCTGTVWLRKASALGPGRGPGGTGPQVGPSFAQSISSRGEVR